jgi:hypothetical protein
VAYDNQQYYTKESINNLLLSPTCPFDIKFLLALLNSSLLSWYYRLSFTNGSTLTVNLSKEYLSQLPIPDLDLTVAADRKAHDHVVHRVDEMLRVAGVNSRRQAQLDKELDEIVFGLFGVAQSDVDHVLGTM